MRSFQRALHRDEAGRLITNPDAGPLFAEERADDDLASGTIYVLRSRSNLPVVAANRELLHKIGVTGGRVETRIANASLDPTFLMADVEVIATYELFNINQIKLEKPDPSCLRSRSDGDRNPRSLWQDTLSECDS